MPHSPRSSAGAAPRLATGVPGLDVVLGGGLVSGGLYLVEGVPGAGKTVLASQVAFHFARQGRRVLFITLIAESHSKLLRHVSSFEFFEERLVSDRITLLSGFSAMLDRGLDGLLQFLAEALRAHSCELLVLDGFAAARDFSESTKSLARFIHQLNTLVGSIGSTALMLAPLAGNESHPEHTLVDGLIELKRASNGLRRAREIEVHKMRGGVHLTGQHMFEIGAGGVHVYPRLESLPMAAAQPRDGMAPRLSTGVPSLDALLGGGLVLGSATSVLGSPGVGKTLLGLSFLAGAARSGRKSLYFGFYEAPERLLSKARSVGLAFEPLMRSGDLFVEWQPSLELYMDRAAQDLLRIVRERRIEALFLDGVEGFSQGAFYPERLSRYLTALTGQLREAGVTTLLAEELPLFSPAIESKAVSLSAMVENVLLLRFFEHESKLRRLLSVIKLRESDFDPGIREFTITGSGIEVHGEILGVEHVLGGSPHAVSAPRIRFAPGKQT